MSLALLAVRLLAAVADRASSDAVVVMEADHRAETLARLLSQLAPDRLVHWFPAWDCLPYDRAAPSADIMGHRMAVLHALSRRSATVLLVTTPEALIQRVPAPEARPEPVRLRAGDALDPAALEALCVRFGYIHADRVDDPGHVAIRGEAVDIFPPGCRPVRLLVADGHVTALHRYDPVSQRSIGDVQVVTLHPVSEITRQDLGRDERAAGLEHWLPEFEPVRPLLDDLPDAALIVEPRAEERLVGLFDQVRDAYRDRVAIDRTEADPPRRATAPDRMFLTADEWTAATAGRLVPSPDPDSSSPVPRFCLEDKPHAALREFVAERQDAERRLVFSYGRPRDLALVRREVERLGGAPAVSLDGWAGVATLEAGQMGLIRLHADHGFDDAAGGTTLVTAADLLGHRARAGAAHAVAVPWHLGDGEFATGDLVIHLDHGMGVLQGIETIAAGGDQEAIRLSYAKGADLLVPVSEMDRVWRYGAAGEDAALDRLDSEAWDRKRARIAREVEGTAGRLVELARARRTAKAPKVVPPRRPYERFVAGFPFAPTPDQMHAIDDCLRDLASGHPMDRLVVGDVGFGKTEVALRAAAAAVLAGYQVAVAAPTTVLVRQHVQGFRRRFEALGIEVAHLSRLVPEADAARVKAGLADGSVRLVVGTQALMAEDVRFNNLGLLIVDEEQRFGTADKAQLRERAADIHVLTLSATPIPRTLEAALVGLQDLSLITTPPARRRPIRTLLSPFDPATLRTALLREKARGGQSFVVVPRIEDIQPLEALLAELMPGFSVLVGHGRMGAQEVDDTMVRFAGGEGDVLLATTIIESGLDVPRANTMIVCEADRFGLAQLHQLRGRVGRGRLQGTCYLTTERGRDIAPATERRLATLTRLDRLGSGMAISAQDLDARGAGDLMGEDQAGHTRLIGLGLYQHLLQGAIRAANGTPTDDWMPELHLGDPGRLPADYIPEPELRINLYARIARVSDAHDLDALEDEMADRFGPLPAPAERLLAQARLRVLCVAHHVARIDAGPRGIALTPRPGIAPEALMMDIPPGRQKTVSLRGSRLFMAGDDLGGGAEGLRAATALLEAGG